MTWGPRGAKVLEPLVLRASRALGGTTWSRRSFLVRSAVMGSALALTPRRYVLEPASAYASVCGADPGCYDGFSAFCCTINHGANFCPEGTYVGGWWKADQSAFCRGAARYYVDCNGVPSHGWGCHCSESSTCDQRHVACAQFRYGNCNLDIPFDPQHSPVVCRVVTCTPPWEFDPACTKTTMIDERSATHSAPCLPGPWPSPIIMRWSDLGGPGGPLGPQATPVKPLPHGEGHYAYFQRAAIYDVSWLGIKVVGPEVWPRYRKLLGPQGAGFPLADQSPLSADGSWFQVFGTRVAKGRVVERAAVYSCPKFGPKFVAQPILAKWHTLGAERGVLGFPISDTRTTPDATSTWVEFAHVAGGRITSRSVIFANPVTGTHDVRDQVLAKWLALGAERGVLGYPTADQRTTADGAGSACQFGVVAGRAVTSYGGICSTRVFGTHAAIGLVYAKWHQLGEERGPLGYLTTDQHATADGRGQLAAFSPLGGATSATGGVVVSSGVGTWAVLGAISAAWLTDAHGASRLGLPTSDETHDVVTGTPVRIQQFETGQVYDSPLAHGCALYGPILTAYLVAQGLHGAYGIPLTSVLEPRRRRRAGDLPGRDAHLHAGVRCPVAPASEARDGRDVRGRGGGRSPPPRCRRPEAPPPELGGDRDASDRPARLRRAGASRRGGRVRDRHVGARRRLRVVSRVGRGVVPRVRRLPRRRDAVSRCRRLRLLRCRRRTTRFSSGDP